jgi:hypothetical protein
MKERKLDFLVETIAGEYLRLYSPFGVYSFV